MHRALWRRKRGHERVGDGLPLKACSMEQDRIEVEEHTTVCKWTRLLAAISSNGPAIILIPHQRLLLGQKSLKIDMDLWGASRWSGRRHLRTVAGACDVAAGASAGHKRASCRRNPAHPPSAKTAAIDLYGT